MVGKGGVVPLACCSYVIVVFVDPFFEIVSCNACIIFRFVVGGDGSSIDYWTFQALGMGFVQGSCKTWQAVVQLGLFWPTWCCAGTRLGPYWHAFVGDLKSVSVEQFLQWVILWE